MTGEHSLAVAVRRDRIDRRGVNAAGPAPVAEAAMKRDTEAVRALLKNGEDVNAAQGDGMTALHWAARNGDLELTQMLLYAGANVKATTRLGGYTPLLMAADQGHANVIAALVAGGADVKAANALGTTPLMLAAASGNPQAVTILVENGAEIEAKEKTFGQTPLMFAASNNRVDAMKALIKAGADRQDDVEGQQRRQPERPANRNSSRRHPAAATRRAATEPGRNGQVVAPGAQDAQRAQGAAVVVVVAVVADLAAASPASIVRTSTTS